ncbi:sconC, partial [Symbiodinium sp. KB8]
DASQHCPGHVDGLKTDGRGSLIQVAGQTRHPGSGHPVPLDPGAEENEQNSSLSKQEQISYFSLRAAAAGIVLDGGEFQPMPIFEEPGAGGGALIVFGVIFLTLVGSLLVVACLEAPLELEDKVTEPELAGASSVRARLRPGPAKGPCNALQRSQRQCQVPAQDRPAEQRAILAPVPEELGSNLSQDNRHVVEETQDHLPSQRQAEQPCAATSQVLTTPAEGPEGPAITPPQEVRHIPSERLEGPVIPPQEEAPEEAAWDPPDMEAGGTLHLPPMRTAFPPWYGGGTPQSASFDEGATTLFEEEVSDRLIQHSLSLPYLADAGDAQAEAGPWFWPTSDSPPPPMTLCPGLIVPRNSECCLVIPIPTKDRSAIFVIVFGTDGQPLLRAEVYRGHNCEPPCGSPMTSVYWPPATASMPRNDQHATVVLTTLPPEMRRPGDVSAAEEPEILSAGYLVRGSDGMEMDIVDGDGRFFGRLGRDPDRRSRYCLRCGEHGETRMYCDGVYEDFALLLTDDMQEVLGEVETFSSANAPFSDEGDKVQLKSSQGEIFEVEPEVACMSTLVKNMVEDSGTDEEIPLPNVKTAILSKVIDYCKYHKDNPPEEIQKPLKSTNLVERCGVSEWDNEYVNIEQEVLFELILAANYLDIKSLLDLTCAKVASMIKGKNTEEIRKQFNIVNDFTPEEEAQVREENRCGLSSNPVAPASRRKKYLRQSQGWCEDA